MRLSLSYEMQRPVVDDHAVVEETIEQCVLADKMGFDTVWFVEHHFLTYRVVLDEPDGIEAHLVREHALLDRLLDHRVVIDHGPLHLVRQAQSHAPASLERLVSCPRTCS